MIHGERTTEEREGNGIAWFKGGGSLTFAYRERERVRTAWMRGEAFVETVAVFGEPMALKLGEVCGLTANPPATFDRWEDDRRVERERARALELLSGE